MSFESATSQPRLRFRVLIFCAFSVAAVTEMTVAEVRKVEFISENAKMLLK
jgi:hypothetical protein